MLATSLTEMINQSECIIFLNTSNSLTIRQDINSEVSNSTWIYAEIQATRILERKNERMQKKLANESFDLKINYSVDKKHLIQLDESKIKQWEICGKNGSAALDFLYKKFN